MKKNIASIAKETMNATMLAPRNVRERKKLKSTIGEDWRRSITPKPASAMAAKASSTSSRVEPQCHELPSTSASTSAPRPLVSVSTPGMSTRWATVSSRDSRTANSVTRIAPTATGRLRKKIDCQLTLCTSRPPRTGPMASAIAETPAQVPIALPRSAGGNALVMIDSVAGIIIAEPMPWIARQPTSQVSLGEKPIAPLDSANTTTPARNTRRRPKRSPRRPPVTSSTAKESV
jgi:hypothetical protein